MSAANFRFWAVWAITENVHLLKKVGQMWADFQKKYISEIRRSILPPKILIS